MNDRTVNTPSIEQEEMLPEYDFSSGVRGKHYKAYRQGHTVVIHKTDGTTVVQEFSLPEGAIVLDPDVRHYFPNSESVNNALRGLIALIPEHATLREASENATR